MVGIFQKLLLFDCRITLYNSRVFPFVRYQKLMCLLLLRPSQRITLYNSCVYFPLSSGLISFGVCYYYGPVTSDRGLDLIRWMLQLIGLSLLYMSTRSDEVSIALCITVVSSHIIRRSGILVFCFRLLPQHW